MATSTPNLNLILPDYSDKADISVLNDNFQKIDEYCANGGVSNEELQNAVKAANAWANATASAESVSADNEADVNLTEGDNSKNLHFSIPRGQPGVLISETEPTDPNVKVWIKPDGEADELEQIKSDVSSLKDQSAEFVLQSVNLFNMNDPRIVNGYVNGASLSGTSAGSSYRTTHPIHLKAGVTYKWQISPAIGNGAALQKLDENGNGLAKLYVTVDRTTPPFGGSFGYATYTPETDVVVRTSMSKSDMPLFVFAEADKFPESYVPYYYGINPERLPVYDGVINPLVGKKIALDGDSLCAGEGYAGGYGKIIAEQNGMTYQNIAVGGATIAAGTTTSAGANRHWICRTVDNLDADADYAIVSGGVNDPSNNVPLGEITDAYDSAFDDSTFCGAFESMLRKLTIRFAGKKIGYIAYHQMSSSFKVTNDEEGSFYWAAKRCCEKWGVPFCDLNSCVPPFGAFKSSDADLYAVRQAYTTDGDGWHPTEEGYKVYYVPKIEAWLRSL